MYYGKSRADPGLFLGGGALVSCSTSTPINHILFFLQNTSCIRKAQVISGGGVCTPCTLPLDPPLEMCTWWIAATHFFTKIILMLYWVHITLKLIKLWRVLRAFSFKTRCNLRESNKILNICKKNWDFLDNLRHKKKRPGDEVEFTLFFSRPPTPYGPPPSSRSSAIHVFIFIGVIGVVDPGEGPPGGGGQPTLIFYQTKTRRAEKLFLRPPPPSLICRSRSATGYPL